MSWNAPEADLQAVHLDWRQPVAERFGDGGLWRSMLADDALRPHLLRHMQTTAFGHAAPLPSAELVPDDLDRVIGPVAQDTVRVAGWFWYAPVLLPRFISRGVIPGLMTPSIDVMRAMRDWIRHDSADHLAVPGDNSAIERAGRSCRLAWIRALDPGIGQRLLLQLPAPTPFETEIAETDVAQIIFRAAIAATPGGLQ
ncbi:MAG: hypothetical protein AAF919_12485 [Pseudomonadota bacterium]